MKYQRKIFKPVSDFSKDFDDLDQSLGLGGKLKRYAKVSTTFGGVMARLLGEGYFGLSFNRDSHAEDLRETLGDLKGPLMKAAQLLATIPGALPPEYAQELVHLQSNAPPMGWLFVKRRMRGELGTDWEKKFKTFGQEATAAASLGQVHKAQTLSGDIVACKLQYPDMSSTVKSDLAQLKVALGIYSTFSKALNVDEVFRELVERLNEELDYELEAHHMGMYRKIFNGHDDIHIPDVFKELSTKRLLTMSWLEGRKLLDLVMEPQEIRNQIARRMFFGWYYPFYEYGVIHGDPHMGNYTFREDYTVNLLDFGCIRKFPPRFIQGVIDLYKALLHDNPELAVYAYETLGFSNLNKDLIEVLTVWARFLYDPLLQDRVRPIDEHHGGVYGREVAAEVHAQLHKVGGVKPPREFVLLDRAAVGMGAVFMHLKAELNWHQEYEKIIENFNQSEIEKRQKEVSRI